jgi:hypothetical protein
VHLHPRSLPPRAILGEFASTSHSTLPARFHSPCSGVRSSCCTLPTSSTSAESTAGRGVPALTLAQADEPERRAPGCASGGEGASRPLDCGDEGVDMPRGAGACDMLDAGTRCGARRTRASAQTGG